MADNLSDDQPEGDDDNVVSLRLLKARRDAAVHRWRAAPDDEKPALKKARDQAEADLADAKLAEEEARADDSDDGGYNDDGEGWTMKRMTATDFAGHLANVGVFVRYNTLTLQYEQARWSDSTDIAAIAPESWEELSDRHASKLRQWMYEVCGTELLRADAFWDLMAVAAPEVDPVSDWLSSLPDWDNTPRLDTLPERCFKINPDPFSDENVLARRAAYCILGAVIARTLEPGAQMDDVWILASDSQGEGKSSFVSSLVPEWAAKKGWATSDLPITVCGTKDAVDLIMGSVLVEIADMAGARAADWSKFKAFVTRRSDTTRLSYDRRRTVIPRRAVFVGTSDSAAVGVLQRDSAGARRFRIVTILGGHYGNRTDQKAHVSSTIAADRAQLWAEALHRLRAAEPYWLADDTADNAGEQVASKAHLVTTIEAGLRSKPASEWDGQTLQEIAVTLGVCPLDRHGEPQGHPSKADQHEMSETLKSMGLRPQRRRSDGKVRHFWALPRADRAQQSY